MSLAIRTLVPLFAVFVLSLVLSACGGQDDAMADRVSGEATGDIVYVDRAQMAGEPCQAVDNTIVGDCSDEDVDALLQEMGLVVIDTENMADAPCHIMSGAIMGDCSDEDIERLAEEMVILVDRQMMADEFCHSMGNVIMGQCTDADVERIATDIRAKR